MWERDNEICKCLSLQASLHVEQSEEATPELLKSLQKKFKMVLMAFPDGPRHHEVEDMVYEV